MVNFNDRPYARTAYNDPDPVYPLVKEYDDTQVSPEVKNYVKQLTSKMSGVDTREVLRRAVEIIDLVAGDAKDTSVDTKARQDDVENRFDDQIAGNTDIDEVIDARRPEGGEAYPTLRRRLDEEHQEVTAQLAQNTNDIQSRGITPYSFGVIGDGVNDDTEALQNFIDYGVENNLIMSLNGTFRTGGLIIKGKAKFNGEAIFRATTDNQPFVVESHNRIEWNGKIFINGEYKALNGYQGYELIHSHFGDVEVAGCKVWGFTLLPKLNNAMMEVGKFRAFYNGTRHKTNFTVDTSEAVGGHREYIINLETLLPEGTFVNKYDIIYASYGNRPYKVRNVYSNGSVGIYNLPLQEGETGEITIYIGGGLNIPSYGDNGVGNWGVMDLFANSIGINVSGLYGHNFNKPVMQGNGIGMAVQNIVENLGVMSPYFEDNTYHVVIWEYMKATFLNPIIEYDKIYNLVNHRLYGSDFNRHLNIIESNKSPNMSNRFFVKNQPSFSLTPSMHYAQDFNSNQTNRTYTINNDVLYQNSLSNFIYMTITKVGDMEITFDLKNQNGDTIEGDQTYTVTITGRSFITITKVENDWKINVFKGQ